MSSEARWFQPAAVIPYNAPQTVDVAPCRGPTIAAVGSSEKRRSPKQSEALQQTGVFLARAQRYGGMGLELPAAANGPHHSAARGTARRGGGARRVPSAWLAVFKNPRVTGWVLSDRGGVYLNGKSATVRPSPVAVSRPTLQVGFSLGRVVHPCERFEVGHAKTTRPLHCSRFGPQNLV
jgi:hypothetical protein